MSSLLAVLWLGPSILSGALTLSPASPPVRTPLAAPVWECPRRKAHGLRERGDSLGLKLLRCAHRG